MREMNLQEFVEHANSSILPSSAYVVEPGFNHLYVRCGKRVIEGQWNQQVLTIANVEVVKEGQGTFSNLIKRISEEWPNYIIYVECVNNKRLWPWLERNGFKIHRTNMNAVDMLSPSYYRRPREVDSRLDRTASDGG